MRVLMVNKFLYPNGGSETYMLKLGAFLQKLGHQVEYFGMEHEKRTVGNRINSYTSNMDFHAGKLQKLLYPFRIIYSIEARKKICLVLEDFQPDVVHLNNFNFQLTPSILYEIKKYSRTKNRNVRTVYTAHDYQLVCPNHMMYNPNTHENCEKCSGNRFQYCMSNKCIHGSTLKSALGTLEGFTYKWLRAYRHIDAIICPSHFMASKIRSNPLFESKLAVLHNFIDSKFENGSEKEDYILYFGRYTEEKGLTTLLNVCQSLPDIRFMFAGSGPMENEIRRIPNIENVGFLTGEKLRSIIQKARFSIYPSEWYENCPFSVMESQMLGTPVLAANIGGVPELILAGKTGELFQSGNAEELREKISMLWSDRERLNQYTANCRILSFPTIDEYGEEMVTLYGMR